MLLSPHVATSLLAKLADFDPRTRERGRRYAEAGRVVSLSVAGDTITAKVQGTRTYKTEWMLDDEICMSYCTCPVGRDCKHAYAVGCCALQMNELDGPSYDGGFDHDRSGAGTRARSPQRRRDGTLIARIQRATYEWELDGALLELMRAEGLPPVNLPVRRILAERDGDARCWLLCREIARRNGGRIPAVLERWRDRPDLERPFAERWRVAFQQELVAWADRRSAPATKRLRLVVRLSEARDGGVQVVLELRLSSKRVQDEPRTYAQLRQLQAEVQRDSTVLARADRDLLEWFLESAIGDTSTYTDLHTRALSVLESLLVRFSDSPRVTWNVDASPQLAGRAGLATGDALRLCRQPAALVPVHRAHDGADRIELSVRWPDGKERPFGEVVYVGDLHGPLSRGRPLVLADGEVSLIEDIPPSHILEHFLTHGPLRVEVAERAQVVRRLAASFPHLRATLENHTRTYAVAPVMSVELGADDCVRIRLYAVAEGVPWRPGRPVAEGATIFEYLSGRDWQRIGSTSGDDGVTYERFDDSPAALAPAAAPAGESVQAQEAVASPDQTSADGFTHSEVWLEAPEPQAVGPAVQWLERTGATTDDLEAFSTAWEERPQGVTYYGDERIRRLLSGEQRVWPTLRIEPSGTDWLSVSAQWEAEGLALTDADIQRLRRATSKFVKLESGWVRRDLVDGYEETARVLAELGVDPAGGAERLSVWQLAAAGEGALARLERLAADPQAIEAARLLRKRVASFKGVPRVAVPRGFRGELRAYQRDGLDFLDYTASLGIGAVLADDMGLGKTVQLLAWLERLRKRGDEHRPSLVVCPASVVHNWQREAARFTPRLRVAAMQSGPERHELWSRLDKLDLVVTNYALLRRDIEKWREVELRCAILDEAQNIKNPDAAVTRAATRLSAQYRLALTGTPLENRTLDLWSITNFVNPGYLGSQRSFQQRFDRLDAPAHNRSLLAAKLRPLLLRRTKGQVATDLPERIEERRDCELAPGQRRLYLAELRRAREFVDHLDGDPAAAAKNKIRILAVLTRLRQICCHPALVGGKAGLGSGKFDALFELLEPLLAEGHKVLVFSQFVECLKLLQHALRARSIGYHVLTGATKKREKVVAAFSEDPDPCCFLVSLKAGGTGLNLTAASYVVLFDPWWNPAVEAQAIDRTHRIGQDRTVIAYRMIANGTIEEKICELQEKKASLVRDILGEQGFARALSRADLDYLLAEA